MSQHELKTLLEIKDNPSLSQRSLSHRLNISLGLTNAILQNLIHRGWVKAQKLTGRKILYLITPKGMARVTNLVYDRFRETQHYYQYTKELITSHLIDLYNQGTRRATIYGTNQLSEITYLSLLDSPLRLHSIITAGSTATTTTPPKKKFLGHEVLTLSDFSQKISEIPNPENLIILSTVSYEENKILNAEIKKYESICQKIKIINLEDVLKNNIQ
ncbi:MAG TPA: hypothetical protein DEG96_02500 [Candidatus Atribacteria bacterium]|nr:hypothetical protein [Candidatus Atribacteria bacterium]